MAEKLKENNRTPDAPRPVIDHGGTSESDREPEIDNGQIMQVIARSFVAIAASMDTFAFIAEKWALKNNILTKEDLE